MKNSKYTEIFRLKAMLENARIEHEFIDRSVLEDEIEDMEDTGDLNINNSIINNREMYQIIIRKSKEELLDLKEFEQDEDYESATRLVSVIQGFYSYGGNIDKLEIMGLTENGEDVEGYLTSNEVFARIVKVYI